MRVVLDCLPFEDPANDARRIVQAGMAGILDSFSAEVWDEWYAKAPPVDWDDAWSPKPQQVEALFDAERGITFCSKHFDDVETRWENAVRTMRAKLHYSRAFYAIPHHTYIGIGEA